jgi:hypothetical protein
MDRIKNFVRNNSVLLFKVAEGNDQLAIFDNRGFEFSLPAFTLYSQIKSQPHLYVAYGNGFYYIGKSFQSNGRWKRSHYYHLGSLAHEILNSQKSDEQRHDHWVDAWMHRNTVNVFQLPYHIQLRIEVKIAFIPFELYSGGLNYNELEKPEIRRINKEKELELIRSFLNEGVQLLNVQNNR